MMHGEGPSLRGGDHDWYGVASNRRLVTCVTKTRYTGTKGECASVWSSDGQIATIKQREYRINNSPEVTFSVNAD